jgi:DNA-binding beta-propeller fold protein YncE
LLYNVAGKIAMKNKLNKILAPVTRKLLFIAVLIGSLVLGAGSTQVMAGVETNFLYSLANFSGSIPFAWANIHVDEQRNEIYVVAPGEKDIRVFNDSGMEVFRFGDDERLGSVIDIAVKNDGNILALSRGIQKSSVILCNFRGEPLSELEIKNLPPDFSGFSPDRIAYREGRIYLLDSSSMRIAVTDANGLFGRGYDLCSLLEVEEKKRGDTEIGGFSLDRQGNMLFTVPVLFSAYTLSPEGKIRGFGKSGGAPGHFGIVGGIVADSRGNYYVADRLKSVVLIFDKDFEFRKEFGYRGLGPHNLIGPKDLVLDNQGRLYVSQLRNRGISVFKIMIDTNTKGTSIRKKRR